MVNVLYMSAEWCGPCKIFKPIVKEVASATETQVNYIDIDQSPDFVKTYEVTSVPTIIIQRNGQIEFRRSGVMSKTELVNIFKSFK